MVRDGCDGGLDWPREELGKGKGLAGVSAQRSRLGRVQVGEDSLVESQICPASEETENRKPQRSAREEGRKRQHEDDSDIDDGESGYSERQDAAEERDGMRGDQLTESDEEGYLNRDGAGNGRKTRDNLAYKEFRGQFMRVTYVQRSLRVRVKKKTMTPKVSTLEARDTRATNLAKSAEDQARSRYLPPLNSVKQPIVRVKTLPSTSDEVRNVQG